MIVFGLAGSVYAASLTSSSSSALACCGVGLVRRVKVCSASPMRISLRAMVESSASRSGRFEAGCPSSVMALAALVLAAFERRAGATGSEGVSGAWSVKSMGVRRAVSSKVT